jgi:hypothetical protein
LHQFLLVFQESLADLGFNLRKGVANVVHQDL